MASFPDLMHRPFILWVKEQWNIDIDRVRSEIRIPGSPERAISRGVVQDCQDRLFLVEKLDNRKFLTQERIARAVEYLSLHGLPQAITYMKSVQGNFLPFFSGSCFRLSRFIEGTPLRRPDYLASAAMGKTRPVSLNRWPKHQPAWSCISLFPGFPSKSISMTCSKP